MCRYISVYLHRYLRVFRFWHFSDSLFIIETYFVKKLKGSRVLNELRSKGCNVSSSAFYRYIQQYKPEFTRSFMRYETKPGEQGQFDWSPYTVMIGGK